VSIAKLLWLLLTEVVLVIIMVRPRMPLLATIILRQQTRLNVMYAILYHCGIFTSTKEVMFLPVFVCLFVCMSVSKITQKVMDESF